MADTDKSWQRFAGAGIQLGAAIALFTLGGQWLDKQYDTSPLWTAIGALLGCGGGMYAIIAAVNASSKKPAKNEEAKQ
ncbi:MAG: AtpZ/AtpI family protein [Planctomycetes bacterium]|nr:AtpZ/AtpI family protein [Planctomycetota bacterium]